MTIRQRRELKRMEKEAFEFHHRICSFMFLILAGVIAIFSVIGFVFTLIKR